LNLHTPEFHPSATRSTSTDSLGLPSPDGDSPSETRRPSAARACDGFSLGFTEWPNKACSGSPCWHGRARSRSGAGKPHSGRSGTTRSSANLARCTLGRARALMHPDHAHQADLSQPAGLGDSAYSRCHGSFGFACTFRDNRQFSKPTGKPTVTSGTICSPNSGQACLLLAHQPVGISRWSWQLGMQDFADGQQEEELRPAEHTAPGPAPGAGA
jgi:hypothetical protein